MGIYEGIIRWKAQAMLAAMGYSCVMIWTEVSRYLESNFTWESNFHAPRLACEWRGEVVFASRAGAIVSTFICFDVLLPSAVCKVSPCRYNLDTTHGTVYRRVSSNSLSD